MSSVKKILGFSIINWFMVVASTFMFPFFSIFIRSEELISFTIIGGATCITTIIFLVNVKKDFMKETVIAGFAWFLVIFVLDVFLRVTLTSVPVALDQAARDSFLGMGSIPVAAIAVGTVYEFRLKEKNKEQ